MNCNFSGFIWSPAKPFTSEILEYINKTFPVLHHYTYEFNKEDFERSILNIYTTDDIELSKVKNVKIKNMINHSFSYTYFKFYIETPDFRKKKGTGNNISKVVEGLKKKIRDRYKTKINNYVHDIIIHISDNYEQTTEIEKIMKNYEKNKIDEFVNLKYFLKCNFKNNVFDRADILVRKYSIEQYLKDKNYDFGFYKKMQQKRVYKGNISDYVMKFKELIESIQKNGFDNNYPIKYSFNYLLRDGSHRLSYILLLNKTFIAVKPMKWDNHRGYSINWFKTNNFNEDELNIINEGLDKLLT